MNLLSRFFFGLHFWVLNALAAILAGLLWSFRWKARTIHLNLALMGLGASSGVRPQSRSKSQARFPPQTGSTFSPSNSTPLGAIPFLPEAPHDLVGHGAPDPGVHKQAHGLGLSEGASVAPSSSPAGNLDPSSRIKASSSPIEASPPRPNRLVPPTRPHGPGPLFRLRWSFRLSQDFLHFLLGGPPLPISLRARDRDKFTSLQTTPSLFLTGHFHHWEALAAWLKSQGVPLLGSARPIHSAWAQNWMERLRIRRGVPVVTQNVLQGAIVHIRSGGCFGILWDQFSRQSRHTSTLFGVPAVMDPLPEILVRRLGPAVWVGFLLPSGEFRMLRILAPNSPLPDPRLLSRRYHRVLETVVRAHPTYWVGLCHGRFKNVLSYGSRVGFRRDVSRETNPPKSRSGNLVSRET